MLLLSSLVIYLWESPEKLLGKFDGSAESANLPYAIVHNASTRHFNDKGSLDYTFEALKLEYFRKEQDSPSENEDISYTLISKPRLLIYHEGEPWHVEALEGKFTEQNKRLLLWNNVIVSQQNEDGVTTTLSTEELEIKPEEKYAYTKQPVEIKSSAGDLTAIGMIANFMEKQITLLSSVKGSYEPY